MTKRKLETTANCLKKLKGEIGEFRTLYNKTYFRIFAFWDKTGKTGTLVVATHGLIKKTGKIPEKEIEKAETMKLKYFELKRTQNEK